MREATPTARVWLACQARCTARRFELFQPVVACPDCGGLLDPVVDTDALAADKDGIRARLRERRTSGARAYDRSGVWRFRELLWPESDDEVRDRGVVSLGEGNAARVALEWNGRDVCVVGCGENPTGSFKDLGMTVLATWASRIAANAQPKSQPVLVCASTGDTSAALAAYGARAGIPVVVLLPGDKISPAQLVQPLAHGAHVVNIDGDFDTCMGVVGALAAAQHDGVLLANSKNPLRLLGQLTVALEIAEAAHDGERLPDVVIVPSGNLGNVSALFLGFTLAKAIGLIDRIPRLVAAQVDAANPLYRHVVKGAHSTSMTAGATHASAIRIGAPVSLPRALHALQQTHGTVTSCSEDALLHASAEAARRGLLVCPQTAAALAGVAELVARGELADDSRIAVIATASGLKFAEQHTAFHQGGTCVDVEVSAGTAALRNAPRTVAATVNAVLDVIAQART